MSKQQSKAAAKPKSEPKVAAEAVVEAAPAAEVEAEVQESAGTGEPMEAVEGDTLEQDAPAEDAPADEPQGDEPAADAADHASAVATGPQSCIIRGTSAQAVLDAMAMIREHGGRISTEDGATVRGPITGECISDDGLEARISVAFPIEPAADEA